jgi:hypothetical protein
VLSSFESIAPLIFIIMQSIDGQDEIVAAAAKVSVNRCRRLVSLRSGWGSAAEELVIDSTNR